MSTDAPAWSLKVLWVRFDAIALGPVQTGFQLAPVIRGTIGTRLRELVCSSPLAASCTSCSSQHLCDFQLLFGSAIKPPRPYVVRVPLHQRHLQQGEPFAFDILLFGEACAALSNVVKALEMAQKRGLGGRSHQFRLSRVDILDSEGHRSAELPYRTLTRKDTKPPTGFAIQDPPAIPGSSFATVRLKVRFLTPTDIKRGTTSRSAPSFQALIDSIGSRCRAMVKRWGTGAVQWPYGAETIKTRRTSGELRIETRRSRSQPGHIHDLSGFVGEVEYTGDLARFAAWLRLGELLHVGDDTAFGAGWFHVQDGDPKRFHRTVWLDGSWPPPPGVELSQIPSSRRTHTREPPSVIEVTSRHDERSEEGMINTNNQYVVASLLEWLGGPKGKERLGRTAPQYATAIRRFGDHLGGRSTVPIALLKESMNEVSKAVSSEKGWSVQTERSYRSRALKAIRLFLEDSSEPAKSKTLQGKRTHTKRAQINTVAQNETARSVPLTSGRSFHFELPADWNMADAKRVAWPLMTLAEDFEPPDPLFGQLGV